LKLLRQKDCLGVCLLVPFAQTQSRTAQHPKVGRHWLLYAEPHPCRPSPRLLQLRGPAASPRRAGARQAKLAVWLMQMRISSCHSCARYGRALPERGSVNPPTPSDRRVGGVARSRGDGVHFLSCHPQCWLALTKCHLNRRQATWNPAARQWKA